MAEINLLRNELEGKKFFSFGPSRMVSFYIVIGVVAVELLIYGAMFLYEKRLQRQAEKVEQRGQAVNLEIGKIDAGRLSAISFQKRLSNLEVLLNNHLFWSPVLDELERYTYVQATYQTLQIDEGENRMILTGIVPSYTDMGKLLLGLKASPHITGINLEGTGLAQSELAGYNFVLEVVFDPKLLEKK